MRIFEMLDVDYEPWGLIKVDILPNGETIDEKWYNKRNELKYKMDVAVQSVSQIEYTKDDYVSADELLNRICEELGKLGYHAERFYLEQINMI